MVEQYKMSWWNLGPISGLLPMASIENHLATRFSAAKATKIGKHFLHPMIRQHRDTFIAAQRKANAAAIVLDVPLLFETGGEAMCDYVIVVYASYETTANRASGSPQA